jgi:uncharacterized membrane protein YhaH (DUF805 family)
MSEASEMSSQSVESKDDRYFSWKGRIGRSDFSIFTFAILAATVFAMFVIGAFVGLIILPQAFNDNPSAVSQFPLVLKYFLMFGWLFGIPIISCFILSFAGVKRLHDLGRSGWHYWEFLIPLWDIYIAIQLFFWKGNAGTNQYGKDPLLAKGDGSVA